MSNTQIYIELSDEIKGIFADNSISIEDILNQAGIEATITYGPPIYQSEAGAKTKDLIPIIWASAPVIIAIGLAISNVLNTIYNRPHRVEYYENIEIHDENGEVLNDENGKPLLKTVKRQAILEPKKKNRTIEFETNLNPVNGVMIKFITKEKT